MAKASTAVAVPEKSRALMIAERLDSAAVKIDEAVPKSLAMPSARVIRIAKQAINGNPKLAECTSQSIVNACIKAAADGLVCDGREAALVPFSDKGTMVAQYIPMYRGLLKLMYRSGLVSTAEAAVVYQLEYEDGDRWQYERGDGGFIKHKPILLEERGPAVAFYAVITMRDGGRARHVMSVNDIYRAVGKAREKNPLWKTEGSHNWLQMCLKTTLRALSKTMPFDSDIAAAFDDHGISSGDYEPDPDAEPGQPEIQPRRKRAGAAAAKLNKQPQTIEHDEDGVIADEEEQATEAADDGEPIEGDEI